MNQEMLYKYENYQLKVNKIYKFRVYFLDKLGDLISEQRIEFLKMLKLQDLRDKKELIEIFRELGRKLVENNIVKGKEENFKIYYIDIQLRIYIQLFWIFIVKYVQIILKCVE